ncbi:MAG: hypothetical protein P8168_06490 [Deltaproteobacteria bacterium]
MRLMFRLAFVSVVLTSVLAMSYFTPPPPAEPYILAVRVETKDSAQVVVLNEKNEILAKLPTGSTSPSFSPYGELYYASPTMFGNEEKFQIYRLDLDSKEAVRISDGTSNDESPVSSPNGTEVAFISHPVPIRTVKEAAWMIYLMTEAGKNRHLLIPGGPIAQYEPCWSPDGKKLIFVRRSTFQQIKQEKFMRSTLEVYDFAKKTVKDILPRDYLVAYPRWSPKGDLIAFAFLEKGRGRSIWVVRPDGTGAQRLTEGYDDTQPSWTPDGKHLLFSRAQGKKRVICEMDLATLRVRTFLDRIPEFEEKNEELILEFPRLFR